MLFIFTEHECLLDFGPTTKEDLLLSHVFSCICYLLCV